MIYDVRNTTGEPVIRRESSWKRSRQIHRDIASAKSLEYQRRPDATPISEDQPRGLSFVRESSDLVTGMGTCTMVEIARWRMEGTG